MISEKEAAERKRKIKNSANLLFQENGVDHVTYGHIAKHSGISETSIYNYFPQKSQLLLEVYKYLWGEIAAELQARTIAVPAFQDACGYQQIDYLIDALQQIHNEHLSYIKFSLECKLYCIRTKYVLSREEYDGIIAPVMQQFTEALRKGVEDKSVYSHGDFDACSFLLWDMLRSYIEQTVISNALYSDDSRLRDYYLFVKSILLRTFRAFP